MGFLDLPDKWRDEDTYKRTRRNPGREHILSTGRNLEDALNSEKMTREEVEEFLEFQKEHNGRSSRS